MRTLLARSAILALVAAGAAGCDATPDPTLPTSPTPNPVTVTFSGTLNRNTGATHQFTTASSGTVQATLTSLSPNEDGELAIGFGVGTWNGQLCAVVLPQEAAKVNAVITGTVGAAGDLCVRVWDNGTLSGETTYEVTVTHP